MENFVVSARKYRPSDFESVVGQAHVTETLAHAIESNQLAQALLFTGPRGVGKTTCARIVAKKLNEQSGVTDSNEVAMNIFELDAASNNSVEDIRTLIEQVRFVPQVGKYKVYIIDEVHMLSKQAFNAFLKTLEEPPAHAIFILATTEKHKIIPTILSRCQIYDFKRIGIEDISAHLAKIAEKEGVKYEEDALFLIAQKADGALRDALSIYDKLVTFCHGNITLASAAENLNILDYDFYLSTVDLALENKMQEMLLVLNDVLQKGFDPHLFVSGLGQHFRDLMVAQNKNTIGLLEVGERTKEKYFEQAKNTPIEFLLQGIEICNQADVQYKSSQNQRLTVEIALMQLASITASKGEQTKKKKFRIIPPPKSVETTTQPSSTKEVEKHSLPISKEKEESKVEKEDQTSLAKTNKPLRKGASRGVSLKNLLQEEEPEYTPEDISHLPKDPFTVEQLIPLWEELLDTLETEEKAHILGAIRNTEIQLPKPNVIKMLFHSNAAKAEFDKVKMEWIPKVKEALNNFHLEFKLTVEMTEKNKPNLRLPEDIFRDMAAKNPLLEKLKNDFELSFYS